MQSADDNSEVYIEDTQERLAYRLVSGELAHFFKTIECLQLKCCLLSVMSQYMSRFFKQVATFDEHKTLLLKLQTLAYKNNRTVI